MDLKVEIKEEPVWAEGTMLRKMTVYARNLHMLGELKEHIRREIALMDSGELVSEMTYLKEETKSELTEPVQTQVDTFECYADVKDEISIEEHTVGLSVPCFKEEDNEENVAVSTRGLVDSCDSSSKVHKIGRELKGHLLTDTGECPYSSNGCGQNLLSQYGEESLDRKEHIGILSPKSDVDAETLSDSRHLTYHCHQCGKEFSRKCPLKKHMLIHSADRSYCCKKCGGKYSRKATLIRHMLTHSGERSHFCNQCDSVFSLKFHLNNHMLTHSKIRPHCCTVCGKLFTLKPHLKSHMLTHSSERPFCCGECGTMFTLKATLKRHMLTHFGERFLRCNECDKSFLTKSALKSHLISHTSERPHCCKICGKVFSRKATLKSHERTHSGERRPYRRIE